MTELSKQIKIVRREQRKLNDEQERLDRVLQEKQVELDQTLVSTAITVDRLNREEEEGQRNEIDEIFLEDTNIGTRKRRDLSELITRLKLLYLVDPFQRPNNEVVDLVLEHTQDFENITEVRNFN